MDECSGIYKINCNDVCVYVGQSINLKSRKASHLRKLRKNVHYNKYLQRLYNKYKETFVFSKLEECAPDLLTEREMYWIEKLKPKCNMQIPSDSTHFTITEQSRQKMSKISKDRMTPEMRKKISEKTKEAMHRPEVWNNFLEGQRNKKNKTAWNKGLRGTNPSSNRKRVYCVELDLIFESAYAAGIYLGAKNGKGVPRVCLNQRNTYKKLHFEYIDK